MTVSNAAWTCRDDAERAAERYQRHGYNTTVVEVRSDRDGSLQMLILKCEPRD